MSVAFENLTKKAADHIEGQKNLSVVKEDGSNVSAPSAEAPVAADPPTDLDPEQKALLDELYPEPKEDAAAGQPDMKDEAIRAMKREIDELKTRLSTPQVERPTRAADGAPPQAAASQPDPETEALLRFHPELEPILRKVKGLEGRAMEQQRMAEEALGAVRERESETVERQVQAALDEVQKRYPSMDQDQVIGQMLRKKADINHLDAYAKASHLANMKRDRAVVEAAFKRARVGAKLVSGKVAPSGGSKAASAKEPEPVLDLKKDGDKLLDRAMRLLKGGADK